MRKLEKKIMNQVHDRLSDPVVISGLVSAGVALLEGLLNNRPVKRQQRTEKKGEYIHFEEIKK